ncbi:UNVERIFIED_CONTAM: hypothetical protein K2H54_036996 [Gekko kuhli]
MKVHWYLLQLSSGHEEETVHTAVLSSSGKSHHTSVFGSRYMALKPCRFPESFLFTYLGPGRACFEGQPSAIKQLRSSQRWAREHFSSLCIKMTRTRLHISGAEGKVSRSEEMAFSRLKSHHLSR